MQKFKPHPFVPGGQLQTILAHLVSSTPKATASYDTALVPLPDGDRLALHIDRAASPKEPLPVVMLLHGLGGSSESSYNLRIAKKLLGLGFDVVRFNHRGCGTGCEGLSQKIYHAGRTEDVKAALSQSAQIFPNRSLLAVGFSLSGNILLRLLGEGTEAVEAIPTLRAALAVCPPIDLMACSGALSHRKNRHLDLYYTRQLVATARKRQHVIRFPQSMNLRLFDDLYTAPQAGFKTSKDYYEHCSSKPVLSKIRLATTILAASDDPIIPKTSFNDLRLTKHVSLHMQRGGGHMGFIAAQKTQFNDLRWMDEAVVNWALSLR